MLLRKVEKNRATRNQKGTNRVIRRINPRRKRMNPRVINQRMIRSRKRINQRRIKINQRVIRKRVVLTWWEISPEMLINSSQVYHSIFRKVLYVWKRTMEDYKFLLFVVRYSKIRTLKRS